MKKIYEFKNPYYAMVMSESEDKAISLYKELISEGEYEGQLKEEIKEVDFLEAMYIYSHSKSEDGETISKEEFVNDIKNNENLLLLVGADLL